MGILVLLVEVCLLLLADRFMLCDCMNLCDFKNTMQISGPAKDSFSLGWTLFLHYRASTPPVSHSKAKENVLGLEYDRTSDKSRQGGGFLGIDLADRLGRFCSVSEHARSS